MNERQAEAAERAVELLRRLLRRDVAAYWTRDEVESILADYDRAGEACGWAVRDEPK